MNRPIISIIIPVYNTSKYLRKCLDSCINQKREQLDYEIIVVNDGSTDNSLNIAQEYENKHNNIKVISQENKKQGAARNNGLKHAKGNYIWFVDSDDWIETNAITTLITAIKQYNTDAIRFDAIDYFPNYSETRICKHISDKIYTRNELLLENKFLVCFPFHIFKKEFIISNKLFFMENIFYEDKELMIKVIDKCSSFIYLNQSLYNVNKREDSTTRTTNYKNALDILVGLESHLDYLDNNDSLLKEEFRIIAQYTISDMLEVLTRTAKDKKTFKIAICSIRKMKRLKPIIQQFGTCKNIIVYILLRTFPEMLRTVIIKRGLAH